MSTQGSAVASHEFGERFSQFEHEVLGKDSRPYDRKGIIGEVISRLRLQDDQVSQRTRANNLYYVSEFQAPLREARALAAEVQAFLLDQSKPSETRVQVLLDYLDQVYIPAKKLRTLLIDPKNPASRRALDAWGTPRTLLPRVDAELLRDALNLRKVELRGITFNQAGSQRVLVPDPLLSLSQEVQDVGESATTENYFRAMKTLAVQMLLTQIKTLKLVRGATSPTEAPYGCQIDPGMEIEKTIHGSEFTQESRRQAITEILYRPGWLNPPERYKVGVVLPIHGPHASSSGYTQAQIFINAVKAVERMENLGPQAYALRSRSRSNPQSRDIDPRFNQAAEIQASSRLRSVRVDLEEPAIEDRDEFEGVMAMLMPHAQKLERQLPGLKESTESFERKHRELEKSLRAQGHDERYVIQKLDENRRQAPEGQVPSLVRFDPQSGLTEYWKQVLEQQKKSDWRELIPQTVREQLSQNQMVFPMPPLRSPDSWRVWAMDQLALALSEPTSAVFQILKELKCGSAPHLKEKDCARVMGRIYREGVEHAMSNPQDALRTGSRLSQVYLQWGQIWDRLQALQGTDRPTAMDPPMSEWEYMEENFSTNPWVQLRLGYLHLKASLPPDAQSKRQYVRLQGARGTTPFATLSQIWDYIAGELGVRYALEPFQANRVLGFTEKKQYWSSKIAEFDRLKILKHQLPGATRDAPKRSVAEIAHAVATRGVESAEEARKVMAHAFMEPRRTTPTWFSDLERVFESIEQDSREGRQAHLVQELVGLGSLESPKSAEILEKLLIDEGMEAFQLRASLMLASDAYKRPTLEKLLEYASSNRLSDLSQNLHDLCAMNLYDESRPARKRFGELYYAILNEQQEFERALGYRGMPEKIRELLHPGFFESLNNAEGALTGAQLLLMVGAFAAGSACMMSVVAAPACAAIFLGYVTTQAGIVKISADRYVEGHEWRARAHFFKASGMTTDDAIDEMVEVGGFGLAFNAAFMYPGLQMTSRGAKMLEVSGKFGLSRTLGLVAATPVGRAAPMLGRRAVAIEVDLLNDLRLARLASLSTQEARLTSQVSRHAQSAQADGLWARASRWGETIRQRLSGEAMEFSALSRQEINLGPLVLKNSPEQIKRAIAVQVAQRFSGQPERMAAFLAQFEAKMSKMHRKALKELEQASRSGRVLSEQSREFLEQHSKYQTLLSEMRSIAGSSLVEYLEKNAHRVNEVVSALPHRWRDLGISMALEGGFGNYGLEGIKRLYLAQDRLLVFKYRDLARVELGLGGSGAMRHSASTVVRQVESLALQSGDPQMVQAVTRYHERLALKLSEQHGVSTSEILRRMKSSDLKDVVAVDELFSRADPRKLFEGLPELKTIASKVLEQNANFGESLTRLERVLSAQQTLLYLDRPAKIRRFWADSAERIFQPGSNAMLQ
jgi:hypothetical protein